MSTARISKPLLHGAILVAAALWASAARAQVPAVDVVVVIMGRAADTPDYLPQLKEGLHDLRDGLGRVPGSRMGLIVYAGDADTMTMVPAPAQPLHDASEPRLANAIEGLAWPDASSGRFLTVLAVDRALEMLSRQPRVEGRRQRIVLISPGLETGRNAKDLMLRVAAAASTKKVPVHVISPPGTTPHKYIAPLYTQTGGTVRGCPDAAAVTTMLRELRRELAPLPTLPGVALSAKETASPAPDEPSIQPAPQSAPQSAPGAQASAPAWTLRPLSVLLLLLALGGGLALWQIWRLVRPRPPSGGPSAGFLYWVEDGGTYPITRLPFRLGNDIDYDLVLHGVGDQTYGCELRPAAEPGRLEVNPLGAGGARVLLSDKDEFRVGAMRFRYFHVPMEAEE